jgi:hypothetical protein
MRVQVKVSEPVRRKVPWQRFLRHEHDPLRIDAATRRLGASASIWVVLWTRTFR